MDESKKPGLQGLTLDQIHAAADKIIADHKDLIKRRIAAIDKQRVNFWAGVPVDWTEVEKLMDPPPLHHLHRVMMRPLAPPPLPDGEPEGDGDIDPVIENEFRSRGWGGPIVVVRSLPPDIGIAPPVSAPGAPMGPGPYGQNQEICGYCGRIKQKLEWCWNIHCKSNQKRNGG